MTAIDILTKCATECGGLWSVYNPKKKASSSEMRKWFTDKAVKINGSLPAWDEDISLPVYEVVLFPNNEKKKCTLIFDDLNFDASMVKIDWLGPEYDYEGKRMWHYAFAPLMRPISKVKKMYDATKPERVIAAMRRLTEYRIEIQERV